MVRDVSLRVIHHADPLAKLEVGPRRGDAVLRVADDVHVVEHLPREGPEREMVLEDDHLPGDAHGLVEHALRVFAVVKDIDE